MIDYKELLKKYIDLVGESEGVDFIPKNVGKPHRITGRIISDDGFSKEELEGLWECAGWDEESGRYL
jgi:hypothetical protein